MKTKEAQAVLAVFAPERSVVHIAAKEVSSDGTLRCMHFPTLREVRLLHDEQPTLVLLDIDSTTHEQIGSAVGAAVLGIHVIAFGGSERAFDYFKAAFQHLPLKEGRGRCSLTLLQKGEEVNLIREVIGEALRNERVP